MEWVYFNLFIGFMLFLDLGVFHRRGHEVKYKEALIWTAIWVSSALIFNVIIYFNYGAETALNFLAGYLIEETLSIDNLFVFFLIFKYFSVPKEHLHRVLFYGVIGALVTRGIFILTGVELIERFPVIIYIFGAFLIYSGIKFVVEKNQVAEIEGNFVIKWVYKLIPVVPNYEGDKFFVKKAGKLFATPLFIVVVVVELIDVLFALDSVPAILAITNDPFIVYTSNVFAIMGLRTLYFVLTRFINSLYYLHEGIATLLIFIGLKMLLSGYIHIPVLVSLAIIFSVIIISVIASMIHKKKNKKL